MIRPQNSIAQEVCDLNQLSLVYLVNPVRSLGSVGTSINNHHGGKKGLSMCTQVW